MASTLPVGLYEDIKATVNTLVPYNVSYSECNAKSFIGHCRLIGITCEIRVSNEYSGVRYFLILTHEIAHMITWAKYGLGKKPHGKEWKDEYRSFVLRFLGKGYFSLELERAIHIHMSKPPFNSRLHSEILKILNP